MEYTVYKKGQITKMEAGTIYRAMKEGKLTALPETPKALYDMTNEYIRFADERYNRNWRSYDAIYDATRAILEGRYEEAQSIMKEWEHDMIRLSGKKSPFHKYIFDIE